MDNESFLTLFQNAGRLKHIKRGGWVRKGVLDPESVSDHSFRCTFMAMVLSNMFEVDSEKLLKMAILHDIAECMVGDITPHDGLSKEEKHEKEKQGILELFGNIPNGQSFVDLWMEYERQESKEARMVRELDKLEMVLTAMEYQKKFPHLNLMEFVKGAEDHINDPRLLDFIVSLKKQEKATSQ
jgi:5'-deoxynucleotidase YfbR-like HD superfamily hydrolase